MNSFARFSAGLAMIGIAAMLGSCEDPEPESRQTERRAREALAELKKSHRTEMAALESRLARLEQDNGALAIQLEEAAESRVAGPIGETAVTVENRPDLLDEEASPMPERKIATYRKAGISGVPTAVAAEILRKAGRDSRSWAALEEIEAQGAGYRAVQAFATQEGPLLRDDRDELVAAAKREHPGDWSAMAQHIHEQVDAWKVLEEWKVKGVPGLYQFESEAVLCAVTSRYPCDWSAALAAVGEEAKAELRGRKRPTAGRRH